MEEARGLRIEDILVLLDQVHLLRQTLSDRSRELTGLSLQQAIILCRIDLNGGRATISELSAAVSRANHTVTAMVNTLERRRLVSRRRESASDRRLVWVSVTQEGAARLRAYRSASQTLLQPLLEDRANARAVARLIDAITALPQF